ncbi:MULTISPECIES: eCIS core domain-containing protein [unclassified Microcoleus]|uniref:eCIS core domain-containing protein n=1 Tax=unclassified Microcoleus TaxID=2642155 RepID=UPI002FCED591
MTNVKHKTVNRAATVQKPAAALKGVQRQAVTTRSSVQIQASMKVSSPKDPAEKEADATAKKIMRMAIPESSIAYVKTGSDGLFRQVKQEEKEKKVQTKLRSPYITRFADSGIFTQPKKKEDENIQRKAEGQPNVASNVAADIQNSMAAGSPLPLSVRRFMEPRFQANFSNVKIHTGDKSAKLNRQLNAQAFTMGNQIFFGKDKFKPETSEGKELIAHELTHTIQQGAAIQRSEDVAVTQQSPIQMQRLGLSDILDGLADLAANVPGFTLLTVIIGRNPINLQVVERNFTNLLRGFMGLIPGGEILFQVLQRYAVVQRIGIWVEQQMNAIGLSYDDLRRRFTTFTDSLSWTDIFSPGDVWRRAQNIFTEPITRIRNFISRLIDQAIAWLKETFMQPLSNFCREIPGYTLVTVMLGRDPFTNTAVDRSALNVVRAFAEFIPGGTEKVNQLVESRGLQRAYEWFVQETQARNLTWARVTGTFSQAWNSLRLEDVLHPIDTIQRLVTMFRPLMGDLVGFAGAALMKLLELIFEAVMGAGGARILAILKRGRDTFLTIVRNPVGFLGNLLRAVGQGVRQFMNNILQHLQQGVIAWLTGPVARAGIQMPERWDLRGIIGFVMQILGLTWDRIRQKLVRLMGERAVATLEAGFQLIQEIRERGLVQALRDRVTEFFGQLREAALGGIKSFIQQRLVMAGIQQLLSLLSPVGAVIQAIIKTYTTIQFFIQKINQILDLVESIVNSIAAIASGAIGSAAALVERTMARTIPVILDFLARFIGLGDVGGQVQSTIRGLQARVDGMLDRAVDWIRSMAQRVASAVVSGSATGIDNRTLEQKNADLRNAVTEATGIARNERLAARVRRIQIEAIKQRYRLNRLELVTDARSSGRENVHVRAVINPTYDGNGFQISPFPPEPIVVIEAQIGPSQPRQGFEEVLVPPTEAGLPGYQRAHLVGAGFGVESPLGVLYAPEAVNQRLQNRGIEALIRGMYRNRFPGAEFFIVARAEPHSGTQLLARVVYELYGQLPGEPRTKIFEFRISVSRNTSAPRITPQLGEVDSEALSRYTNFVQQFVARRS